MALRNWQILSYSCLWTALLMSYFTVPVLVLEFIR